MQDWRRHAGQGAVQSPIVTMQHQQQQPPVAPHIGTSISQPATLSAQAFQMQAMQAPLQQLPSTTPSHPGLQLADASDVVCEAEGVSQQHCEPDGSGSKVAASVCCCASGAMLVAAAIIAIKHQRRPHFHGFGPPHHMHHALGPYMMPLVLLSSAAICGLSSLIVFCRSGPWNGHSSRNRFRIQCKKCLKIALLAFVGLGVLAGTVCVFHHYHHHGFWAHHRFHGPHHHGRHAHGQGAVHAMSETEMADSIYKGRGDFKHHTVAQKGDDKARFKEIYTKSNEAMGDDAMGGEAANKVHNLEPCQQRRKERLVIKDANSFEKPEGQLMEQTEKMGDGVRIQKKSWAKIEKQFSQEAEVHGPKTSDVSKEVVHEELHF
jgi:hypothetical protein